MIGLNLDLFDTNIINLTVVIGCLVSFGGDFLRTSLETRQQAIWKRFMEAEKNATRYEELASLAWKDLQDAENEANKLREVAKMNQQELRQTLQTAMIGIIAGEAKKWDESQKMTLEIEETKIFKRLCRDCSSQALLMAKKNLKERLATNSQQHRFIGMNLVILNQLHPQTK
jgi:F-type H+-transporting ATPase subunit b